MPIEAAALSEWPYPEVDCPKCGKRLIPFNRGQVQRRKKSLLGKTQPYCAIICAACKEILGWEDPTEALHNYERTQRIREQKARKREQDRAKTMDSLRNRVFVPDHDEAEEVEDIPTYRPRLKVQNCRHPHVSREIQQAALRNEQQMYSSTAAPSTISASMGGICSSAATFYQIHPRGCMCDTCVRLRMSSRF